MKKKRRLCGSWHIVERSSVGQVRAFLGKNGKPVLTHGDALGFIDPQTAAKHINKYNLSEKIWQIVLCDYPQTDLI